MRRVFALGAALSVFDFVFVFALAMV